MTGSAASRVSGRVVRGMLRLLGSLFPTRVPVLTYHSVDDSGSLLSVGLDELREHLLELRADNWRSLSIAEYGVAAAGKGSRERSVLITFDDGYLNFYEQVLPLLVELDCKATVFVCADFVGREPEWMTRDAALVQSALSDRLGFDRRTRARLDRTMRGMRQQRLMGWAQLNEVVGAGIDVQSHAAAHHFLTRLPEAELAVDLQRSRGLLEEQLGVPVRAIAYPYGDCDERVARAAADAGFDIGFVTDDPLPPGGPLMRSRTGIGGGLSPAQLRLLLTSWPIYPRLRSLAHRSLARYRSRPSRRGGEPQGPAGSRPRPERQRVGGREP